MKMTKTIKTKKEWAKELSAELGVTFEHALRNVNLHWRFGNGLNKYSVAVIRERLAEFKAKAVR